MPKVFRGHSFFIQRFGQFIKNLKDCGAMENVIKKSVKTFTLILLFASITCFTGTNPVVAFQENFSSNKLTLEETFENGEAWQGDSYAYQQFAGKHSFNLSQNPVFKEKFSGRFELRYGDPMVTKNGGPRSEVLFSKQSHKERWYSFAVYFPSHGWKLDKDDEIVSQWHASNGTPPLSLRVRNGKLRLRIGHTENSSIKFNYIEFGDVPKDEWNEFVFHVIHSEKSDGLIEVWKNGKKLATHKGPNLYSDGKQPRWKIGIYKSTWGKKSTDVNLRITYFDNVRIGNEKASLEDMMSTKSNQSSIIPVSGISTTSDGISLQQGHKMEITATVSPSGASNKTVIWSSSDSGIASVDNNGLVTGLKPGKVSITAKTQDGNYTSATSISVTSDISQQIKIEGFSLVNASTNNPFKTLSDGDQLEYSQFKDMFLNFRAHTYPEEIGSVEISLSGPVNSSRTDNGFTYDLLNNNGIQLPAGEYTLTANPYAEINKGGTKGTSSSIKFSLVDANKTEIPDSPTPISPENGSNGVISAVNLEWQESEQSESYSIQVAEDKEFAINLMNLENISTNSTEIDQLNPEQTYFWRVKAHNDSGSSSFCEPWSFRTNALAPEESSKLRVEGFSLLEAGAGKVLFSLSEGDQLDYDQLKDMNLNFRANTYPKELGSVAIVLSGPVNSSRTDNGFTYDLLNDKGIQLPQGEYTLKATPYGERENGGEIGTPLSIGFSIREAQKVVPEDPSRSPSDLVGHWKMEEGSGSTLIDDSGNGNNATIVNNSGVTWVPGKEGLALRMTGTLNRFATVQHNPSLDINNAITIAAWIRPSGLNRKQILSKGGPEGYEFSIFENGKVEFRFNRDSEGNNYMVQSLTDYPTDGESWMHVAVTFDGTTSKIYVNGKVDNSATYAPVLIKSNTTELQIGARKGNNRWEGDLDEIRLYKGALNEQDILDLYIDGTNVPDTPATPLLSLPEDNATNQPKANLNLSWDTSSSASAYQVQVSLNPDFTGALIEETGIVSTTHTIEELMENTTYFWRVKAANGNGVSEWSATWKFQIIEAVPEIITLTGVKVEQQTINMDVGASSKLAFNVSPADASNNKVIWSSSNASIASVDEEGLVTAVGSGKATITAKTEDGGFTSQSTVTVNAEISKLRIEGFSLLDAGTGKVISGLNEGDQLEYDKFRDMILNFRANTYPEKLGSVAIALAGPVNSSRTDNGFTYDLLNNKGIQLPQGEYTLTATPYGERENGGEVGTPLSIGFSIMEAKKVVPVAPELSSPADQATQLPLPTVLEWHAAELADAYHVQVAGDKDFDNPLVNLENSETAQLELEDLEEGTEYFWRVKSENGNGDSEWSAPRSFTTEVLSKEESAERDIQLTINLKVGNTLKLTATVTDEEATHKEVIWSSSDNDILSVDENGVVTAKNPGTAIIAARTLDGTLTSSTRIKVSQEDQNLTVESFLLINALSNSVIHKLSDGEVIDIHQAGDLALNFRAIASSPATKSVFISLAGPVTLSRTANDVDFELMSENGIKLTPGNYNLIAVPYTELDKGGIKGEPYFIQFTVTGEVEKRLLNAPDLLSPSLEDKVAPGTVQFFWVDNIGADLYELQVSLNPDFDGSAVIKSGPISQNYFDLKDLEQNRVYYWRVRAQKNGEWSEYSTSWNFQTDVLPINHLENPALVYPQKGESLSQTETNLSWNRVEFANKYNVYLSEDSEFQEGIIEYKSLKDTVLDISGLKLNKAYFWKVEVETTHEKKISEVWDFRTENALLNSEIPSGEAPLTVSMFPNPSVDFVNLELGGVTDNLIHVTLSELNGNTIFSEMMENHQGITTLNLSNIKSGIYLVSILANRQRKVMKLIKN